MTSSQSLDNDVVPGEFTVTISAYLSGVNDDVIVRVDPDFLNLGGVGNSVNITFVVATRGYEFSSGLVPGIVPGPNPTPQPRDTWNRSFTAIDYSDENRKAELSGVNQNGLAYSYTINVVHSDTKRTGSLDPIIQNENR